MKSLKVKKLKKGDEIVVLLGKDRGKSGKIERVLAKKNKVYVAGINIVKRHVKKHQGIEGGIIDIIKPLDISNVQLTCPSCGKPARVEFEIVNQKKTRICKKCRKEIK